MAVLSKKQTRELVKAIDKFYRQALEEMDEQRKKMMEGKSKPFDI